MVAAPSWQRASVGPSLLHCWLLLMRFIRSGPWMAASAAGLLPVLVEGRLFCAMVALYSTSVVEALIGAPRRSSPQRAAKWFVPGGGRVAGAGVSSSVAKDKDLIAFSIFLLGSFLYLGRTMIYCFE